MFQTHNNKNHGATVGPQRFVEIRRGSMCNYLKKYLFFFFTILVYHRIQFVLNSLYLIYQAHHLLVCIRSL